MILIADGGSTKTSWCLLDKNNHKQFFSTEGFNPYFVDAPYIASSITKQLAPGVDTAAVQKVYFYGAGCFPGKDHVLEEAIKRVFPNTEIITELDLLAAARALLGSNSGFAAILGTGTNSCIFDGTKIIQNIDSLGYILGDEGSGADMGKRLLRDYIRESMPEDISALFLTTFKLDKEAIFERIYTEPLANQFCAGFGRFILEHLSLPYFDNLVHSAFRDLFKNIICHYPNYQQYAFNCVGSIGYYFKEPLEKVLMESGMAPGRIIKTPIEALVDYHASLL